MRTKLDRTCILLPVVACKCILWLHVLVCVCVFLQWFGLLYTCTCARVCMCMCMCQCVCVCVCVSACVSILWQLTRMPARKLKVPMPQRLPAGCPGNTSPAAELVIQRMHRTYCSCTPWTRLLRYPVAMAAKIKKCETTTVRHVQDEPRVIDSPKGEPQLYEWRRVFAIAHPGSSSGLWRHQTNFVFEYQSSRAQHPLPRKYWHKSTVSFTPTGDIDESPPWILH